MKTSLWLRFGLAVVFSLATVQTRAAAPAAGGAKTNKAKPAEGKETNVFPTPLPAVAKQNFINVRGQPALTAERVTNLKKGQPVTVLEEITVKKPRADEPDKWFRIALPTNNVSVWINAMYVDANATIKARRLNLRSGPGENFSVLGRLEKGAPVKELEHKGDWIRIEAPESAGAYVAAHLISLEPAGAAVAAVKPPSAPLLEVKPVAPPTPAVVVTPPPPPVVVVPPQAVVVPPPAPLPVVTAAPPPVIVTPSAPLEVKTPEPKPADTAKARDFAERLRVIQEAAAKTPEPVPVPVTPVTPGTPVAGLPGITNAGDASLTSTNVPEEPPIKRVVTREGILKGSSSIQAPTYFELRSLDTHKIVDYVLSTDTNLVLKQFKGKRVLVTGEEEMDERWTHTPVIKVDSIEIAP